MPRNVSPGSQHREVDGHVGLRARVRLDVGVIGAEELLGAIARDVLDDVDLLAATVVALAGKPLGVLVGEHGTGGLEHRQRDEVLGGDQLDGAALASELGVDGGRDLGVLCRDVLQCHARCFLPFDAPHARARLRPS